ncbi:hypothetical protein GCM10027191_09180 [Novilysobacter erysipheiresistens]
MGTIFCPGCSKQTQTKVWDFLPWLGNTKEVFWCRTCHQWFAFSDGARRTAFWASIAAIALPVLAVRLYFELSGARGIGGWPAWTFLAVIPIGYNIASALVLTHKAQLVGPIDYAP